jgi:hypothetical protein
MIKFIKSTYSVNKEQHSYQRFLYRLAVPTPIHYFNLNALTKLNQRIKIIPATLFLAAGLFSNAE